MRPKDFDFCFFDKCFGGVPQSTSGFLRRVTPALLRSLATKKKPSRYSSLVYSLLKTQQTAPERKRNASVADQRQANKEQTIVICTADGSTCPAATQLLGKPGLLHSSHSKAKETPQLGHGAFCRVVVEVINIRPRRSAAMSGARKLTQVTEARILSRGRLLQCNHYQK